MKSRTFVGTYQFDLLSDLGGRRIGKLTFNLKFIDGNPEIEKAK